MARIMLKTQFPGAVNFPAPLLSGSDDVVVVVVVIDVVIVVVELLGVQSSWLQPTWKG